MGAERYHPQGQRTMGNRANPYHWDSHSPVREVLRPALLSRVRDLAVSGKSAILLGARGTGKSVFLSQLERELAAQPEVAVIRINAPPPTPSVERCIKELASRLGVAFDESDDVELLLRRFQLGAPERRVIVLLYDEADQYAKSLAGSGRALFNDLEAARRELSPGLAVVAAGGLGLFMLRDTIGSAFTSRAEWLTLAPFDESDLDVLAAPFNEAGRVLAGDLKLSLLLGVGGNPALLTYGLEMLWDISGPTVLTVASVIADFRERHADFLKSFERSFADPEVSSVPRAVWKAINRATPPVPRAGLLAVCNDQGPARLNLDDALLVLKAAGLIRVVGSALADPLEVHPMSTLINLPDPTGGVDAGLRKALLRDTAALLAHIHSLGMDFYRPDRGGQKALVPESVFSAVLAVGLRSMGWSVERESINAAGRTDLKVSHPASEGHVILEVKIWGRNDYKDIQQQVVSYVTKGTLGGVAIMITDAVLEGWGKSYVQEVLDRATTSSELEVPQSLSGHFLAKSKTPEGAEFEVNHLLARIPRR